MTKVDVMVTGAAGFLGFTLCDRLEAVGQTVLAVDRVATGRVHEGRGDLTDLDRLVALARDHSPAAMVHCGAISGPMLARNDPMLLIRTNMLGTANVLEAARLSGAGRFVYCSSAGAYGDTPPPPVAENVALHPTDLYGASKAAGELLVAAYGRQFGLDAVSLRMSWIYGPRRVTSCVIRSMLEGALAGRPTALPFGRDFHRQFVHVEDATDAVVAALGSPRLRQDAYNITGGTRVTLDEVASIVGELFPSARIELQSGRDPEDDLQQTFDISAAERDFGYRPRTGLREGIANYASWLAAQRG